MLFCDCRNLDGVHRHLLKRRCYTRYLRDTALGLGQRRLDLQLSTERHGKGARCRRDCAHVVGVVGRTPEGLFQTGARHLKVSSVGM